MVQNQRTSVESIIHDHRCSHSTPRQTIAKMNTMNGSIMPADDSKMVIIDLTDGVSNPEKAVPTQKLAKALKSDSRNNVVAAICFVILALFLIIIAKVAINEFCSGRPVDDDGYWLGKGTAQSQHAPSRAVSSPKVSGVHTI